ncbi:MAG TPA: kelch-like protein [Gammaproteobacteria bacterium]|nr:kelch-like protein [Gammaproteobacteria bacterium]
MSRSRISLAIAAVFVGTLLLLAALRPTPPAAGGTAKAHGGALKSWQSLRPFKLPRRALAAVAARGHLYVIGGMDGNGHYVAPVEYAPILADGRLGPWRQTSALQEPRFYLATVALDGYLYALGGASGPRGEDNRPSATVERAAIQADGSLGPWQRLAYLTTPRRGLKAVVRGRHIYALGGYNGSFLKSVEHSRVAADGTPGPWRPDPERARVSRYIHSAAALGHHLYLLAGHVQHQNRMSYGDVESAALRPDGNLKPWHIQPSRLNVPRFIAEAFALENHLYILGGHDGGRRLRSVEYAPVDETGRVGPWTETTPLPEPRSAAAVAVWQGRVYVLGGMGGSRILSTVTMSRPRSR